MRSYNLLALLSVFTASASATDFNGLMRAHLEERQLADPFGDLLCLANSTEFLTRSLAFVVLETLGDLSTVCPNGLGDCDLSTTDLAAESKADCTGVGGKVFEENFTLCKSTIDDIKAAIPDILAALTAGEDGVDPAYYDGIVDMVNSALDSIEDTSINVTGVPVCLSSECSDDLDLFSVLASFVDVVVLLAIDDTMTDDEKAVVQTLAALVTTVLEGEEDCSTNGPTKGPTVNPNPNGSTTSSSSVTSKFAPAAVALGAAMFTL